MAITFNDNIQPNTPKSLDSRYSIYESGQTRPYNNTLEVTNKLDLSIRYIGLTVLVGADEYWFKSGILDNNLVKKEVTIDTDSFLTKTGSPRQVVTRATEFNNSLYLTANPYASSGFTLVGANESDGQVYRIDPALFAKQGDFIKVSPSTPQTANISLDGTISNSKFQVQATGNSFWQKSDNSFFFNINPTTGLNIYGNTPFNFYGATTQKMQIKNDDNGLVISNTLNQTKFKFSDLGTLTLNQVPSNGPNGAPTLVRNPTTGNIELGPIGGSGFVDLTTDQLIAGNKTFSSLGTSTLNGTLNITSGSIANTTYSNKGAYWDVDGNLTQIELGTNAFESKTALSEYINDEDFVSGDGTNIVGFVANIADEPYMRHTSTNEVIVLATAGNYVKSDNSLTAGFVANDINFPYIEYTDGTDVGLARIDAMNIGVSVYRSKLLINNIDNTSDLNKPVSTATSSALALKQNLVTLTTTGSGAATFNQSTGALNIPTSSGFMDLTTTQTATAIKTFSEGATFGSTGFNNAINASVTSGLNAVNASSINGAAIHGTATLGAAGFFDSGATGSGSTLVVNNSSTGLLATFGASGSTKAFISNDGTINSTKFKLSTLNLAPLSSTDTGVAGELRFTSTYIYICTNTDTWVRVAVTTW